MKIYLWNSEQEFGPYSREEIFGMLREQRITEEMWGRREDETEWRSLREVLRGDTAGLFSASQIEQDAPTAPPLPAPVITNLVPKSLPGVVEPKSPAVGQWKLIACAVVLLLLGFSASTAYVLHFHQTQRVVVAGDTSTSVAKSSTASPSNPSSETVAITPSPTTTPDAAAIAAVQAPTSVPTIAPSSTEVRAPSSQPNKKVAKVGKPTHRQASRKAKAPELKTDTFPLPVSAAFPVGEMLITKTVDAPHAALVICADRPGFAPRIAHDQAWRDFAIKNNLLLVTLDFHYDRYPKDEKGFRQTLLLNRTAILNGLKKAGLEHMPLLVYGTASGGNLAFTCASLDDSHILGWAGYTDSALGDQIERDKRPGLMICDYEEAEARPALQQAFGNGRAQNKNWTWLSVAAPVQTRGDKVNDFVRSYFSTLLQANRDPSYFSNDDFRELSKTDCMISPPSSSWLPDKSLLKSWKNLMPAGKDREDPIIIQQSFKTYCDKQPQLQMFLRLPPGTTKDHPPQGTLAFCTWQSEAALILDELKYKPGNKTVAYHASVPEKLIPYADAHHYALLTWSTQRVWSLKGNTDDLSPKEQWEFDQNFDKLSNAWENGLETFHRQNQVPDQDLLLFGMSRGAQWAHRLALRKPERFLAVHVHIPSTFDTPSAQANRVLWLLTTGEMEVGYTHAQEFYASCRALGYPIIFKAFIGLGHSDNDAEWDLGFHFFDYALSFRDSRRLAAVGASKDFRALQHAIKDDWLKPFREPQFVGDWLNQTFVPLARANQVPLDLQVPLPTQQIADAWNR